MEWYDFHEAINDDIPSNAFSKYATYLLLFTGLIMLHVVFHAKSCVIDFWYS